MTFEWKLVVTFKDDSTKECHGINSSPRKMIHMTMISMAIQTMAMKQAKKDSKEGQVPVVFHRKNNKKWLVTMELEDDWIEMYNEYYSSKKLAEREINQ